MKSPVPSPVKHPNAYAGATSVVTAGLLIAEFHDRLGVDLTQAEAVGILALINFVVLFLGKKVRP